ncbi:NUDIX hydrolase [Bacillus sp. AK031]
METEILTIFDEEGNRTGTASRQDVHKEGYWHETFHCWFIKKEIEKWYLYFQLRSSGKKDYPNLLDITAAGHLLSHESCKDGVREVKEETGIEVKFEDLIPLGIIPYEVVMENFIDRERAHLFLYEFSQTMKDFTLQHEEVSGIYRADVESISGLIDGTVSSIDIEGFTVSETGDKFFTVRRANMADFVPHEKSYYKQVLYSIQVYMKESAKDER